jgi:hypothetical protein
MKFDISDKRILFVKTCDNFYYNLGREGCYDIVEDDDFIYVLEDLGFVKISQADVSRVKYVERNNG